MKPLIMAPLRGFTDAVFRNAFQSHFQGIDEAIAPFLTSIKGRRIKPSHLVDLAPEANMGLPVVPQILSNHADEFICLANTLVDLGYSEINWNLGCPYPMVAKKLRGSGLLPRPDLIDSMLGAVLNRFTGKLSIKTRLGRHSADEMKSLIPVFNRYPLARVIVHPRTGVQMYDGAADLETFAECLTAICHPVVYNGDIRNVAMFHKVEARFPDVSGWMIGRGLLANPFLAENLTQGCCLANDRAKSRFAAFHGSLVDAYRHRFSGPAHVLDRMKGLWRYFRYGFVDGPRILKRVRKAGSLEQYQRVTDEALTGDVQWFA